MSSWRAFPRIAVIVVAILAVLTALWVFGQSRTHPMTDAASVETPVVNVAALVPGQVVEVAVSNNQRVSKGELLFRVDPEPYKLQLQQARAQLTAARSELKQG